MSRHKKCVEVGESFWSMSIIINNVDWFAFSLYSDSTSILWSLRWFWKLSYYRRRENE